MSNVRDLFATRVFVPCNLCGAADSSMVSDEDQHGLGLRTVICRRCGLLYFNPRPDAAAYEHFYQRHYHRLYPARASFSRGVIGNRVAAATGEARCQLYKTFLHADAQLLELGPGDGAFLLAAKSHWPSARFCGLDVAPDEVAVCRQRGLEVSQGSIEDAPRNSYTHGALFHTLEHALDPLAMLQSFRECLGPAGYLFIEVPDIESEWRGLGMVHVAHPYMFNPTTLSAMLQLAGYVVLKCKSMSGSPFQGSIVAVAQRSETSSCPAVPAPDVELVRASFRRKAGNLQWQMLRRWLRLGMGAILSPELEMILWEQIKGRKFLQSRQPPQRSRGLTRTVS